MVSAYGMLAAFLLTVLPASGAACTKTVRWFDDPPYSFRQPDGQIVGLDADLARAVLQRMGCHARFVNMPWARALVELETGRLDILPGTLRSAARERFAHFSDPLPTAPNVLYLSPAAARTYRPSTLGELAGTGFRLGVQIGVSYGAVVDALKATRFKDNLVPVTLRRNAWRMMEMGRIDGMIADEASANVELRQLGLEKILLPSRVMVATAPVTFAFSKTSIEPGFVTLFSKHVSEMRDDGSYRALRERYLPCASGDKSAVCK